MRTDVLSTMILAYAGMEDFPSAHRVLDEEDTQAAKLGGNLPGQSPPDEVLADVACRHTELALKERKLPAAQAAGARYVEAAAKIAAQHPDNMDSVFSLSYAWDLMSLIYQEEGDSAQVRAWQQKKLDLWKDWDAHRIANPFSRAQQEDATAALAAVARGVRMSKMRY
jgi:hypothetical protein